MFPAGAPKAVTLMLSAEGDFSTYVVRVQHAEVDEQLSEASFGFKAACPSPFDCRSHCTCGRFPAEEPVLDYLARDYQSFRRMLLDFVTERNPNWTERLPPDLGITLVELFAYAGDHLSYFQDAVATEAYLDTALHRVSVRRHARLIDYPMHDGCNARTFVHLSALMGGTVAAGTRLSTRIDRALIGTAGLPGAVIPPNADFAGDPALAQVTVFETEAALAVRPEHNELRIHTWGDVDCCLGAGATELFLYHLTATGEAVRPALQADDLLLIEELASPRTGERVDANPAHRWVVRLVTTEDTSDEALTDLRAPRLNVADPALPLQRVTWSVAEALPEAIQVSAVGTDRLPIDPVTIARGNIAAADHGLTIALNSARGEIGLPVAGGGRHPLAALPVPAAPLTIAEDGPAMELTLSFPGQEDKSWSPVPDLLDSTPYDQSFVAEIDEDGAPTLRFGDDFYGRAPLEAERAQLRMRLGNGRSGNVGGGSLVHIATASGLVESVYQPLAARGGVDPQTIAEVRKIAPAAFRAEQFRAVTEADWQEVALRHPEVLDARASFRWTGSWHTVFVAIHPRQSRNLLPTAGGGFVLETQFSQRVTKHLRRFKLAGYDLVVTSAVYVPIEIAITLCIARGYFPGDVMAAVRDVLAGFFDQARAGFGKPVYLSQIYAALDPIEGLELAGVTTFKRYWEQDAGSLERGVISIGAFEIARLDNNRARPSSAC